MLTRISAFLFLLLHLFKLFFSSSFAFFSFSSDFSTYKAFPVYFHPKLGSSLSLWTLFPSSVFLNEVINLIKYLFRSRLKRWHFWIIFGGGVVGGMRLEYLSELRKSWEAILDFIQSLQANAEIISQRSVSSSACKHSFVIAESCTQSAGKLTTQCLQTEIIIIIIILNKIYFDTLLLHTVWQSWNMYMN